MLKDINIKNRVVDMYDVDTGLDELDIVKYLDKKMKVRLHSVTFGNSKYTFTGRPDEQAPKSITISGYKIRDASSKEAVIIK